jgi:hypothetical protein
VDLRLYRLPCFIPDVGNGKLSIDKDCADEPGQDIESRINTMARLDFSAFATHF